MPHRQSHAASSANGIRVLIVDDEDVSRRLLRSLLVSIHDVEVVAEARSAQEARQKIAELQPDLVFMDVEIPGGNGIELIQGLETPPHVIFVTAHPQFALPAFEIQAVDFLVKPVRHERFIESVRRARRRIAEGRVTNLALRIAGAAAVIRGGSAAGERTPAYPDQITIRVRRRIFWIDVADIIWIQGASQYSRVHARSGEFLVSRSLASLECELDPEKFFRIHRSAIVNAAHVQEIRTTGDGRYNVFLHGGPVLPMGRSRREILRKLVEGIGRS